MKTKSLQIDHLLPIAMLIVMIRILCLPAAHALVVSENLTNDTTWTLADSPVEVTVYDFVVGNGATLTIEPGVTVLVTRVTVNGQLHAQGDSTNRIVMNARSPYPTWGPLYFRRDGLTRLMTNRLSYVDLTNMASYIYVSEHTLLMDHCTMVTTGSLSYGLASYVNNSQPYPYADAHIELSNNIFRIATTRSSGSGHIYGIVLDGFRSVLSGNTIELQATNSIATLDGIRAYVSNTEPFTTAILNNRIDIIGTHPQIMNTYGVSFDSDVDGVISGNVIRIDSASYLYGIAHTTEEPITHNDISLVCTSGASFGYVYGIHSQAPYGGTNDLITANRVDILSTMPSRYLYGILLESGRCVGNHIRISNHHDSGTLYGIHQEYYSAFVENNTVILESDSALRTRALQISANYNATNRILACNNLAIAPGLTNSWGVYVDGSCSATVNRYFNLMHGFEIPWPADTPGGGSTTNDPRLEADSLHLQPGSAALDSGTNQAWMTGTRDLEGYPRIDNQRVDIGASEHFYRPTNALPVGAPTNRTWMWQTLTGSICRLYACTNLTHSAWQDTGLTDTAETATITFTCPPQVSGSAFYTPARVVP